MRVSMPSVRFATLLACALLTNVHSLRAAQRQPSQAESKPEAKLYRVAGTIVNAQSGEPLSRARVTLSNNANTERPLRVITADDGHFEFRGLVAGKFSLQGAKRGFVPAAYEQHEQFSTAIVTGTGVDTENLRLQLTPLAFLSGKVIDESGEAVRSANVVLYRQFTTNGWTRTTRVSQDNTDDQGYFEFPAMPSGDYFVSASGRPWYAMRATAAPQAGSNAPPPHVPRSFDVAYPTTYYNSATDSDAATMISVKAGDGLRIDLHLSPAPALHLIFRTEESVQGFSTPIFQKHAFDATENQPVETQSVAPGVWEVSGVPAGRYTVISSEPGGQRSSELSLSADGEVDVSRGEASAQIVLHVKPPSDEELPSQLFFALRNPRRRFSPSRAADGSGAVTFPNVAPGRYSVIAVSSVKPYAVMRMTSQSSEIQGRELEVPAGASLDLTVYLSSGVVNIEGAVKRGDKPASGIMVALVPKNPEAQPELFRRDQSDLDGSFIVRGVIPGQYTIIAVEGAWGFPWLEKGVLARYLPKGQTINVTESMKRPVYLPEPLQVQPR